MKTKSFLILCFASALLSACGYRVGSALPENIRTVYVPPVINKTPEPLIETTITHELINEIRHDGTLKTANKRTADAELEVTVTDYKLSALSFTRENEERAREYRITLRADMVLRSRTTGAVIAEQTGVFGEGEFFVSGPLGGGDLSSSKAIGMPVAARDLAKRIIDAAVEIW